jgi:ribokinase
MQVLCAGHVNWDVTLRVDRLPDPDGEGRIETRTEAGGGSAANVATALASLDADATLFGSVGDDDTGRRAREELAATGVDTTNIVRVERETATKYLVVDGDGEVMVLSNAGANEAFAPSDLDRGILEAADRLHLTGQCPETAALLAERAAGCDTTVSFDPGRRLGARDYGATVARSDLLFLNEREASCVVDGDLLDAVGRETTVVVKRGCRGATVHRSGREVGHPGYPIDAVDTTGAGDAFAAGYLAAERRLGEGGSAEAPLDALETVLSVANACGALASLRLGARASPTWTAVEAFLADRGG